MPVHRLAVSFRKPMPCDKMNPVICAKGKDGSSPASKHPHGPLNSKFINLLNAAGPVQHLQRLTQGAHSTGLQPRLLFGQLAPCNVFGHAHHCRFAIQFDHADAEIHPASFTILADDLYFITGRSIVTTLSGAAPLFDHILKIFMDNGPERHGQQFFPGVAGDGLRRRVDIAHGIALKNEYCRGDRFDNGLERRQIRLPSGVLSLDPEIPQSQVQ